MLKTRQCSMNFTSADLIHSYIVLFVDTCHNIFFLRLVQERVPASENTSLDTCSACIRKTYD